MKKIFLLIALIYLSSCNDFDDKIVLHRPVEDEHLFIEKIVSLEDGRLATPVYKLNDTKIKMVSKAIDEVKKILILSNADFEINEIPQSVAFKPNLFYYILYVNEKGSITNVVIVTSPSQKADKYLVNEMKNWNMNIYLHDGEPKKYAMVFEFSLFKPKKENNLSLHHCNFNIQEMADIPLDEDYFITVEEMPSPIGGMRAIQEKVVYPEIAKRAGIQGRVFVKAFIDEEGNVAATDIIKGIGSGLDEAAINAIEAVKFNPGKQKGKPVKVQVSIPIMFKLSSENQETNNKNKNKHSTFKKIEEMVNGNEKYGEIKGVVLDKNNNTPLAGANLVLIGSSIGASTNNNGEYQINKIPRGEYRIKFVHPNYKKIESVNYMIEAGKTYKINLELY